MGVSRFSHITKTPPRPPEGVSTRPSRPSAWSKCRTLASSTEDWGSRAQTEPKPALTRWRLRFVAVVGLPMAIAVAVADVESLGRGEAEDWGRSGAEMKSAA